MPRRPTRARRPEPSRPSVNHGLDDAIERCNAYAEAGADVTFVDAPRTRDQLEEIARRVDGPLLSNMSETGRTPPLTADELQELGYSVSHAGNRDVTAARDVYGEHGFGGRQGAGRHPALVVVDFNYAFTDPSSPLHCDTDAAVEATARLLEAARAGGRPVAFTTLEYDTGGKQVAKAFIAKSPALTMLTPGSRWAQIDERIAPRDGEPVLLKLFASAFFGTALQPMLTAAGCDTLVVTGASTSGCVRATVVDGVQHGLLVLVPREAVADRAQSAHDASLLDIDAKYGDVVSLEEAISVLRAA